MSLTGNLDTDINILLLLKYKDLRHICHMNQYTKQMCLSNDRLMLKNDKVNQLVDKVLQITWVPCKTTELFEPFLELMNDLGIMVNEYRKLVSWFYNQPIFKTTDITFDEFKQLHGHYTISDVGLYNTARRHEITYSYKIDDVDHSQTFKCTLKQMHDFLTIALYDELIRVNID